jgi:hypothetical protein
VDPDPGQDMKLDVNIKKNIKKRINFVILTITGYKIQNLSILCKYVLKCHKKDLIRIHSKEFRINNTANKNTYRTCFFYVKLYPTGTFYLDLNPNPQLR